LPPWAPFEGTRPGLDPGLWAMLLPLGLAGILIQTSAEELLFRGYLQQQLAARFRSPLVWMGVPSAIFAVAHFDPSMGTNAWLIVAWAALFGVLMADLTARAGSIGPATAIHFTNNAIGMLVISPPDYLSGLALFLLPFGMDDAEMVRAWLPVDFALMVVMWLTARLALRR
jgi:membrane protease YdiL (CAAX protease family)